MRSCLFLLFILLQDSAEWSKMELEGPAPRYVQNLASDSAALYLFAGKNSASDGFNDLWRWKDDQWEQLPSGATPRWDLPIIYEKDREQLVVFGGRSFDQDKNRVELNDTWIFKENSWSQVKTKGPSPRSSHTMAYHSKSKRTILFGGRNSSEFTGDTWAFNGETWGQLTIEGPEKRMGHTLVEDPKTGNLILFGGNNGQDLLNDTWVFNGREWKEIKLDQAPSPRMAHTMEFDQNGNGILFGGWGGQVSNETWRFSEERWQLITTADSPEARLSGALGFDQEKKKFILFGGSSEFGNGFHSGTWEFSLNN